MANNPYVNKIEYAGQTLIDLTDATASADKILDGYTAYGASGAKITGSVTVPTKTSDLTNDGSDGVHPFISDAGVTSFNGATGAVTYTAPVTSVNGQTGAVALSIPAATSDLTNDSGFITSSDLPPDWFSLGTKITSGDLDDYQTAGRYFCEANAAANISHKPTSSAFALYVAYIYNRWRPFQLAFDFDARFYVRVLTSNGWTGWTTSYPLLNATTQTTAGVYALDAAVGKSLADALSALSAQLSSKKTLYGDTAIASGTDVNTINTIGTYYAGTNNIAASLSNFPITNAGKMVVEGGTSPTRLDYLRQTVTPYNGPDIYIRTSINSGSSWSAWKKVTLVNA